MRILVDECLPRQLGIWLERVGAFDVSTVQDEGWANVTNGKCVRRWSMLFLQMHIRGRKSHSVFQWNRPHIKTQRLQFNQCSR